MTGVITIYVHHDFPPWACAIRTLCLTFVRIGSQNFASGSFNDWIVASSRDLAESY